MRVILASSSVFRKQLLSKLKIPFKSLSPNVDERKLRDENVAEYVKRLSIEKARKIASNNPDSIVIGSDEVADLNGKVLGKPLTLSNAKKQLKMLSGNKVTFRTGLCVINSNTRKYYASVNNYSIYFKDLDNNIINNYLKNDDVLKCAKHKNRGLCNKSCKKMKGNDPSSIMGLPLIRLIQYLKKFGIKALSK